MTAYLCPDQLRCEYLLPRKKGLRIVTTPGSQKLIRTWKMWVLFPKKWAETIQKREMDFQPIRLSPYAIRCKHDSWSVVLSLQIVARNRVIPQVPAPRVMGTLRIPRLISIITFDFRWVWERWTLCRLLLTGPRTALLWNSQSALPRLVFGGAVADNFRGTAGISSFLTLS